MVFQLKATEIERRLRESKSGNIIKLKTEANIYAGEYVVYGDGLLGQVLSIVDYSETSKWERTQCGLSPRVIGSARYVLIRQIETREGVSNPEPDSHKYGMLPKVINEAIPTANVAFIPVDQVYSIAFLFHIDEIQAGRYNPGGIRNGYLVRRYKDPQGRLKQLKATVFKSFYEETSYSKRIWDNMVALTESVRRSMSARGQWDGQTKHIHAPGTNVEHFRYLRSVMFGDDFDGELIEIKSKGKGLRKPQKVLNPDLSAENKRVRQEFHMVRVLGEPALKRLKGAFGNTFAVANPTPVPKLKDIDEQRVRARVPLKIHTLLRIVTCRKDHVDADPAKEILPIAIASANLNTETLENAKMLARIERQKHAKRCPFPGVDVEFSVTENGLTDFHLAVKFKKLRGDHEAVTELLEGEVIVATAEGGSIFAVVTEDDTAPVELNDPFVYDDELYKVVSIDGEVVQIVREIGDPGAPIEIDLALATNLVNAYLN